MIKDSLHKLSVSGTLIELVVVSGQGFEKTFPKDIPYVLVLTLGIYSLSLCLSNCFAKNQKHTSNSIKVASRKGKMSNKSTKGNV
jgi:hypothetical protein